MVPSHWYNIFFVYLFYGGHSHFVIRPLGWLAIVIIAGVVGYGIMRNR
jgi:hypothetical protein